MKTLKLFLFLLIILMLSHSAMGQRGWWRNNMITKEDKPGGKKSNDTIVSAAKLFPDTIVIRDTVTVFMCDNPSTVPTHTQKEAQTAHSDNSSNAKNTLANQKLRKENAKLRRQVATLQEAIESAAHTDEKEKTIVVQSDKFMPVFKVQISARRNKITDVDANTLFGELDLKDEKEIIEEYISNDSKGFPFKYMVGTFSNPDDAVIFCKYINEQRVINGAFVVAYYKNERITVKEARTIIEQHQNNEITKRK